MAKGSSSGVRSGGNGRLGKRDRPATIVGETARAHAESVREMRRRAAIEGHRTHRARATARVVDLLTDPDDPRTIDEIWETLSDRECELVLAWCCAEEEREARKT